MERYLEYLERESEGRDVTLGAKPMRRKNWGSMPLSRALRCRFLSLDRRVRYVANAHGGKPDISRRMRLGTLEGSRARCGRERVNHGEDSWSNGGTRRKVGGAGSRVAVRRI